MILARLFITILFLTIIPSLAFGEKETVLIDVRQPEQFVYTDSSLAYIQYPLGFLNRNATLTATLHAGVSHVVLIIPERHLPFWVQTRDNRLSIYPAVGFSEPRPYKISFPRPIPADDRYVLVVQAVTTGGDARLFTLRVVATGVSPLSESVPSEVTRIVQNLTQVQTNIVNLQQNISRVENNLVNVNQAITQIAGDIVKVQVNITKVQNSTLTLNQKVTQVAGDLVNIQNSTLKEIKTINNKLENTLAKFEGSLSLFTLEYSIIGVGLPIVSIGALLAIYVKSKLSKGQSSSKSKSKEEQDQE